VASPRGAAAAAAAEHVADLRMPNPAPAATGEAEAMLLG
jgi:hypothetical protein